MEDTFDLTITFRGKLVTIPARIQLLGYIYRIETLVNGIPVFFERDEERQWRALVEPGINYPKDPDTELLQAIITEIDNAIDA